MGRSPTKRARLRSLFLVYRRSTAAHGGQASEVPANRAAPIANAKTRLAHALYFLIFCRYWRGTQPQGPFRTPRDGLTGESTSGQADGLAVSYVPCSPAYLSLRTSYWVAAATAAERQPLQPACGVGTYLEACCSAPTPQVFCNRQVLVQMRVFVQTSRQLLAIGCRSVTAHDVPLLLAEPVMTRRGCTVACPRGTVRRDRG